MLLITLLLSQPLSITLFNIIWKIVSIKASGASGRGEGWLSKVREFNAVVLQFWPGKLQCLEKQHTTLATIITIWKTRIASLHLRSWQNPIWKYALLRGNRVCILYITYILIKCMFKFYRLGSQLLGFYWHK
jgi:hypothetical protein